LLLEPGDIAPADAIVAEGHGISTDESSLTGESDTLRKVPVDVAIENTHPGVEFDHRYDPFILSGTKILDGVGKGVVTGVGPNSLWGKTMMCTFRSRSF
jgi:P-type Ca2+ transporter type 2C